jgi:RNA polymerase sigma-70 factor (ECF subfamily)
MLLEERRVNVAELAALGKLFEEHRPRLLAMLRRRIDPALAARLDPDGILADAFLRARNRWRQFTESGRPAYPWLYGLVRDSLYDAYDFHTTLGRDYRREVPWPDDSASQLVLGLVGSATRPSTAFARKELQARMRQALALLKSDDQEILCLHFFDQLTHPEIGQVLNLPDGTVRQRYARALRRLRDLWQKLFADEASSP